MNSRLLKAIMMQFGDTAEGLANILHIARGTLSSKMTGYRGAEFTQSEIVTIKERYSLSAQQVEDIFFTDKVS